MSFAPSASDSPPRSYFKSQRRPWSPISASDLALAQADRAALRSRPSAAAGNTTSSSSSHSSGGGAGSGMPTVHPPRAAPHPLHHGDPPFDLLSLTRPRPLPPPPMTPAAAAVPTSSSSSSGAGSGAGAAQGPAWWSRLYRADNRLLAEREALERAREASASARVAEPKYSFEKLFPHLALQQQQQQQQHDYQVCQHGGQAPPVSGLPHDHDVGGSEGFAHSQQVQAQSRSHLHQQHSHPHSPSRAGSVANPNPSLRSGAGAGGGGGSGGGGATGGGGGGGPRARLHTEDAHAALFDNTDGVTGLPSRGLPMATVGFGPKGAAARSQLEQQQQQQQQQLQQSAGSSDPHSAGDSASSGGASGGLRGPQRPHAALYPAPSAGDPAATARLQRAGLSAASVAHTARVSLPAAAAATLPPAGAGSRGGDGVWRWVRDPRAALPAAPEARAAAAAAAAAAEEREAAQRKWLGTRALAALKQTRAMNASLSNSNNSANNASSGFSNTNSMMSSTATPTTTLSMTGSSSLATTAGSASAASAGGAGDGVSSASGLPLQLERRLRAAGVTVGVDREPPSRRARPLSLGTMDPVSRRLGFALDQDLAAMPSAANYSQRDLYALWLRFKALCGLSGRADGVSKEVFRRGVLRLTVEDDLFVSRVYDLVDEDGSGVIEWSEFLFALDALESGSLHTKCRFFMQTYDLDGDGAVSREDLRRMFTSSSLLLHDKEEKKRRRANELLSLAHGFFRPSDRPRLLQFKRDVLSLVESLPEDEDAEEADANRTARDVVDTFVGKVFARLGKTKEDEVITMDELVAFIQTLDTGEDVWDVFGRSMLKDFDGRK